MEYPSDNMVELRHVKKAYKGNDLYTDLNLTIKRGESCAVVGVEGAGKSVLLKMVCGLARPDAGEVIVGGEKVGKGKFPQDIGVSLDGAGFLPNETGLKNLSILAGIRKKVTVEELKDTMRLVELNPDSQLEVGRYSPWMKRRLSIAQALMEKPSLLILDEPFKEIGLKTAEIFRLLLVRLNVEEGVTILMTSSRPEDICGLYGSIYWIKSGSLTSLCLPPLR